ncbi:membrane protein [Vibrio variabilis]|uniref:Membrane protein n=2 Tax=Vibrio TaxID=662 RepID=A0ABR4YBY2_9VIBR|nr:MULTISPECIES: hypothetical protein [Vibrio]EED26943.1 hypothetical protein VPMS16_2265 [Vibrio sp. 16]KHT39165.1 membrane protein [Vibrio sinaloensis]KHA60993.1 membrane protein [Vibrio variabilis]KHD23308.1 membrane protein [Vibrio caribbeanicus]KHT47245.1 membrane protein [Vibrio sinaloensis]
MASLKRLIIEFLKYYLAAVVVIGIKGELFNIALRVWSNNQMTFYQDGLWQITLFLALVFSLHTMVMKYCPE